MREARRRAQYAVRRLTRRAAARSLARTLSEATMARTLDFYFDFISPYSYLAHQRVPEIASRFGYELAYKPVDLKTAKLLAGNTAPRTVDIPLKIRYSRVDQQRWAKRLGVPIQSPRGSHDSARLNRGTFYAEARGRARDFVTSAWRLVRGEGNGVAEEATFRAVARALGWNEEEFLAYTDSPAAIALYEEATKAAHARGVFGVPTMMIGDEMWWGNDRLDFLEERLTELAHRDAR
jgi:2-hydroxychromene-2-carboxylate isomerase